MCNLTHDHGPQLMMEIPRGTSGLRRRFLITLTPMVCVRDDKVVMSALHNGQSRPGFRL